MTTPDTTLTFYAAEADPASELFPEPIDGRFSRLAWLPQLGTTAWLLWSALAIDARTNSPTVTAPPLSNAQLRRVPPRVTGIQADLMRTYANDRAITRRP